MSVTEALLTRNSDHSAEVRAHGGLATKGAQKVAVVACMDSRVDVFATLRLAPGEAHVIRNAGGVVTEDTIRSLTISQRLMGTEEIILIHHTDCGMLSFTDLADDIRRSVTRIKSSPFVPHTDAVRGFILDLATGRLEEVDATRA